MVCFRAASSTNFASTLSCPSKAYRAGKKTKREREKEREEKRVTMKPWNFYNIVLAAR